MFCEFCEISKNIFFTELVWATASENKKKKKVYVFMLIYDIEMCQKVATYWDYGIHERIYWLLISSKHSSKFIPR